MVSFDYIGLIRDQECVGIVDCTAGLKTNPKEVRFYSHNPSESSIVALFISLKKS